MRCTRPLTVGFQSDGKTLCWSQKKYSKEFAPFQLPCGKCISCRLIQAREKAVRCVHEASMYGDKNTFLTLTYSDENLESDRLIYAHAQKFIRDLRYRFPENPIPTVVTGEYGPSKKRPHWHILLFNFTPPDKVAGKKNKQGDILYTSKIIDEIWSRNNSKESPSQIGPIDLSTAGYVCRYQLKKQEHGSENDLYKPIVRYSSKYAIGKSYIEENWKKVFSLGYVQVNSSEKIKIPRYYESWLKAHHPDEFEKYVLNTKVNIQAMFRKIADKEELEYRKSELLRISKAALNSRLWSKEITKNQMREIILAQKSELIKAHDL